MRFIFLLALFAVGIVCGAKADTDSGLYAPLPPEDSAFVRFVNFNDGILVPKVDAKKFDPIAYKEASPYFILPEGQKELQMGDDLKNLYVSAGRFYTVIYKDKIITFNDKPNTNRAKATISLYNLGSIEPISLWAEDGTVELLSDVEPYRQQARAINSVKTDFSVYQGDVRLFAFDDKIIERNNHYSVFYALDKVVFVTAETNTRK